MSELISLAKLEVSELEWRQPALARKYELSGPSGAYARLEFQKLAGSLALGTTARGSWTFKRQGMLKSQINIRFADSEQPLATYEPNFTGQKGALKYKGGQYVEFQATNFFNTEWQWLTPEGVGLIGFRQKGAGKPSAQVFLGEDALERVDLDLLLLLGFYVLLLLREDANKTEE
jgi:hypothetical protein